MKNLWLCCCLLLLFIKCTKQNEIEKYLNCTHQKLTTGKIEVDAKSKFSIKIPENWNINLYSNELQTSIFIADTTKQLTQTLLLDFSLVSEKINLNTDFILQEEVNQLQKKLVKVKEINNSTKNQQQLAIFYRGTKNELPYQTMHQFIALETNFMHIKVEVFGDENIRERLCEAQKIINSLKFN